MSKYRMIKYSRGFIEMMAEEKIATNKNITRDYDILKDKERGLTTGQLAIKYGLSVIRIKEILAEYRK